MGYRIGLIALILVLWLLTRARGDEVKDRIAAELKRLEIVPGSVEAIWPKGTPMPKGLQWYTKTQYAQYLSITNGRDSNIPWAIDQDDTLFRRANPNRLFPWRFSGGLHELPDWNSRVAIVLPAGKRIQVWSERVEAGARRLLPKLFWSYPEGTQFTDILSRDGKVFEIRVLEKTKDGWSGDVVYRAKKNAPAGYMGAGQKCSSCHDRAGEQPSYGSSIRGSDSIFSFSPFVDGSFVLDTDNWPVEWRRE